MKIFLIAFGWAVALSIGTFFLFLSNLSYHLNPQDIMSEFTRYGAIIGSIGGLTIGIVLMWTKTVIKPSHVALITLIWGVSFLAGLTLGWQWFLLDASSQIFSRGMIVGMTIGGTLGGFFTALLLNHYKLLYNWTNISLVTIGWFLAVFDGSSFIFGFNFLGIPVGFTFAIIVGGMIIGTIGGSVMFWRMR
ncbi:hypothetical protein Riv7116_3205 [Rivularia sp. PCC 7116]|uniref:hypothetical protein n=1 Tax=Rivularia sp. PCC 7116 TaxID=373994 RepID=UPI00029F18DF|nr:hypothetical protein [Rivularia sp. PCC 7116]AFY55676.1 hypothetical protein Riv7116_3205 [Rivularia sp. PCC 7116]